MHKLSNNESSHIIVRSFLKVDKNQLYDEDYMTKVTVNVDTERLKSRFWQDVIRSNKDYVNSNKETNTDCFKILDIYPLKSRSKASGMLKKRKPIESEQTKNLKYFVKLHILAYTILFIMTSYKVAVLF